MAPADNTPVQADALVEAVNKLRLEMELRFSGQFADNAVNTLDAVATRLAHQPTTDATPGAYLYSAPDFKEPSLMLKRSPALRAIGCEETPLYAHPPADKARIAELDWLESQFQDYLRAAEHEFGTDDGSEYRADEERAKRIFSSLRTTLENRHAD